MLMKAGAQSGDPKAIKKHPHFRSSVQKILSLICSKEGFVYAVAWLDEDSSSPASTPSTPLLSPVVSKSGRFQASSIWYASQGYVNALSYLRKLKDRGDEKEYVRRVAESRKPLWVEEVKQPAPPSSPAEGVIEVQLRTAFFVPVVRVVLCCVVFVSFIYLFIFLGI